MTPRSPHPPSPPGVAPFSNDTLPGGHQAKEDGELFLYHANCAVTQPRYGSGKLTKTTLAGKILWQHVANFGQDPKAL